MIRFSMIALMAFAGGVGQAQAQEIDCATAMVQADLNQCAAAEWEAADQLLNQRYKEAMALLRDWDADLPDTLKGGAEALREAQRAWITYRDAACAAEGYPMRGGSAEPLLVYGCKARLTEARTKDLEGLLDYDNL
ncbi:lysozyme inhibitor LprI family protein [Pseudogemmobacter bohemicus]|uniref:lysozyme inhibitor LprI family protein n=1 Tax=Pseudogemmobacter bohemicus TaxID=2250708 RepID=UPI000DD3419E|nr:lysozyme inhibitor LprI family protein [Pseudogemmobacter bohemicus]